MTARFREARLAREALEWRMPMLLRVAIESKAERTGQGGRRERGKEGGGQLDGRRGSEGRREEEWKKGGKE